LIEVKSIAVLIPKTKAKSIHPPLPSTGNTNDNGALSRRIGADTDSFAYSNDGCPSVLTSIPLRYMHTTVEMLHRDDIDKTTRLMHETLLTLTPKTNLSYME
jgi:hypothetical protein